MKKVIFSFVLVFIMASCTKNQSNFATMDFAEVEYDFGSINEGQKVQKEFSFTNTGKFDLIITDVKGSCGCTVGEYPKQPVKPNENGVIKVSFNSRGKQGQQEKTVTIFANTQKGQEIIKIFANVKTTSAD